MEILVAAVAAVLAGAATGAGVRAVLARLRRGAVVHRGWCEGGVVAAWTPLVLGVAAGVVPLSWLPAWLALGVLVVAGTATDLARRRLPDAVTLPALPVLLATLVPRGTGAVLAGLAGAVVLGGAHAVVHLAAPHALGAGDVKLSLALGAPLAAASWWALVAAPVLAAIGVLVLCVMRRRRAVAFGPVVLATAWCLVGLAIVLAPP